jgi:purine-binding chemotaxis protein CheW
MENRDSTKPRQDGLSRLVVFTLDEQRYALRLEAVERIVRLVEVSPLPKAPEIVLGVVNVQGRVLPVVNIRRRFRLPDREADLRDQLILAWTSRRPVVLVVDAVGGVVERTGEELIPAGSIVPGTEYVDGVVKLPDRLVLIHDLDKFLSLEEETKLGKALGAEH